MKLTVFFSWQSETDKLGFTNRSLIKDALCIVFKEIGNTGDLKGFTFELKEGLTGEPGTPDVADKMFEFADNCDIFVGDFTVAQRAKEEFKDHMEAHPTELSFRFGPNLNVIAEYSRSQKNSPLFYKQTILLSNEVNGTAEEDDKFIPFDYRGNRWPITFRLENDSAEEREKAKKQLVNVLRDAVRRCALEAIQYRLTKYRPFIRWYDLSRYKSLGRQYCHTQELDQHMEIIRGAKKLRIVGGAGLGKTRLVVEAFRNSDLKDKLLYYDCNEEEDKDVRKLLKDEIFPKFKDAVIVLDNCDEDDFEKYHNLWKNFGSSCRLIAICDDSSDRNIGGIADIKLTPQPTEVIAKIIQNPNLTSYQKERIIQWSGGNPRMAILMDEALRDGKAVGDLSDSGIINRIIGNDKEERTILQTLALFEYIGWEKELRPEIEYVAKNQDITPLDISSEKVLLSHFDAVIKKGIEKQIIERKGRTIGIPALPISLFLVEEWLAICTPERFGNVLEAIKHTSCPAYLVQAFLKKMSLLGFQSRVAQLIQPLLEAGGKYDSVKEITSKIGSELLHSFVNVLPESVLQLLYRRLAPLSISDLSKISDTRRELVWSLEKLAFRSEFFEQSAYLLMRLAIAENDYISNNATGQFLSLFPILLASTEVNLARRLDFLKENSTDPENQTIILNALKSALKTFDFTYFHGAENLGRTSRQNYDPNEEEIRDYLKGVLELLYELASQNQTNLSISAEILQDTVIGLCRAGYGEIALAATDNIAALLQYDWDGMYDTLDLFEERICKSLPKERNEEYHNLLAKLRKNDIVFKFHRVEKDHTKNWNVDFEKNLKSQASQYEALAKEFILGKGYDKATLQKLMMMTPSSSSPFGQTMARITDSEKKKIILKDCIEVVNTIKDINTQISHDFIAGLTDEEYTDNLSEIMTIKNHRLLFGVVGIRGLGVSNKGLPLIEKMVEESKAPSSAYIQVYLNLPLRSTSTSEIITWLDKIKSTVGGLNAVLEIGHRMLIFTDQIKEETVNFYNRIIIDNKDNTQLTENPSFWTLSSRLLAVSRNSELAKVLTEIFLKKISDPKTVIENNYLIEELLQKLVQDNFSTVWPIISEAMIKDESRDIIDFHLSHLLYDTFKDRGLIDAEAHKEELIKWCEANPEEAPRILVRITGWEGAEGGFSELTKYLIDKYGDNEVMLRELSCQMNTMVSIGSILPYYDERKAACESLLQHPNPNVRKWAAAEVSSYEYQTLQNKNFEEENFK